MKTSTYAVVAALLFATGQAAAEMPYPSNPSPCGDPNLDQPCIEATAYAGYLFLPVVDPLVLPNDYPSDPWKLTSAATGEPAIDGSAQELYGVRGASVDRAWQTTTGRPDVSLAVLDSGIRWAEPQPDLVNKFYLNRRELPVPEGSTNPRDAWDRNGDGFFTMPDYLASAGLPQDSRVSDQNGNGVLDPEDLIFLFSDGVDDDQNGYVDDISGWDFFEDDNDPLDEVRYGHGTGESHDSGGEANNGTDGVGVCPNCLLLEVRVGDSFVADVNNFAQGVVFAVDSGARVVQEALGTLNQTAFGQQAVDYAWRNGVLVVASAADEESNHHNYPANYNHTLEVNSVTRYFSQTGIEQSPRSYLYLSGCTNYGGHIHLSVPSSSCSSEATGLASGMAALVASAAQNAVDGGRLMPYRRDDGSAAPFALSAEETRQILTSTADDVNFDARNDVKPPLPQKYVTRLAVPGTTRNERFPSIAGWDQYFGYGRVNARRAVERVAAGDIPPEAAIAAPAWFDILDPGPVGDRGGLVELRGRVAANRSATFRYSIEVAPSVQPAEAAFELHLSPTERSSALEGVLGQIDTRRLLERMAVDGPAVSEAGSPDPDRFSFTVRLRVVDAEGRVAEDRRTLALHHDADLFRGVTGPAGVFEGGPVKIGSDGVSAPATADLDGDGIEDLLFGTSAGTVEAFALRRALPAEGVGQHLRPLPGWPVRTDPLELHTGSRGFSSGAVDAPVAAAVLGPVVVGDLDRDGLPEVAAADLQGRVYVWNRDGTRRPGFPVQTLADYSFTRRSERDPSTPEGKVPDRTNRHDSHNSVGRGIVGGLALGNLDDSGNGSLEIVAGALDRHVYAWRHDGTPVPGWPVLVKDPAKVAGVDPITDEVTLQPGSGAAEGTKIVAAPSLGDLDGDGKLEVVTVTNETYREPTNAIYGNIFINIFIGAGILEPGNTRVFAIHGDGAAHGLSDQARGWNPAAFVRGWPVATSILVPELLPFVGEGSNGPPALADVDGDGRLEVATFSAVGPAYLFRADGTPFFGSQGGIAKTFDTDVLGRNSNSSDAPSFATLGAPVLAEFGTVGEGFHLLGPASGLGKFLDNQLPARQSPADNHLAVWNVDGERAGKMADAFPRVVNDLQFFGSPAVADLDADGRPEAIAGTGVYDLHAIDIDGKELAEWPKFTGGWMIGSPAVGDLDGDGKLEVAAVTREGNLFVWRTQGLSCGGGVRWRRWHHDEWGTGNYHTDARPPGVAVVDPSRPATQVKEDTVYLGLLRLPGNDLYCGEAASIEVRHADAPIRSMAAFVAAPRVETLTVGNDPEGTSYIYAADSQFPGRTVHLAVVGTDVAGNRSPVADLGAVTFALEPTATVPPSPTPTSTVAAPSSSGGGCTAAPGGAPWWPLLAGLVAALFPWRRRRASALERGSPSRTATRSVAPGEAP